MDTAVVAQNSPQIRQAAAISITAGVISEAVTLLSSDRYFLAAQLSEPVLTVYRAFAEIKRRGAQSIFTQNQNTENKASRKSPIEGFLTAILKTFPAETLTSVDTLSKIVARYSSEKYEGMMLIKLFCALKDSGIATADERVTFVSDVELAYKGKSGWAWNCANGSGSAGYPNDECWSVTAALIKALDVSATQSNLKGIVQAFRESGYATTNIFNYLLTPAIKTLPKMQLSSEDFSELTKRAREAHFSAGHPGSFERMSSFIGQVEELKRLAPTGR